MQPTRSQQRNSQPSAYTEKGFTFIGHDYDYIRAKFPGVFYWCEDKSVPLVRLKSRQRVREGDVLGYLEHFEGMYGNIITEVVSEVEGYILRKKVKNGKKFPKDGKLFFVYVTKPSKNA